MKTKIVVKKSYSLAKAHHNLSLSEQRFINMCSGRLHKSAIADENTEFLIRVDRFSSEFGITEKETKRQFKVIEKKAYYLQITLPDLQPEPIHIINEFVFKTNNEVYVKFNPYIIEHIANLQSKFIMYDIKLIARMNSSYSIRLYEILKTRAHKKAKWCCDITLCEIRSIFCLGDRHKSNSDLNKILIHSINEITKLTDISVTVKYSKLGRTVVGYSFYLQDKSVD